MLWRVQVKHAHPPKSGKRRLDDSGIAEERRTPVGTTSIRFDLAKLGAESGGIGIAEHDFVGHLLEGEALAAEEFAESDSVWLFQGNLAFVFE
jgi:hypothetical protein